MTATDDETELRSRKANSESSWETCRARIVTYRPFAPAVSSRSLVLMSALTARCQPAPSSQRRHPSYAFGKSKFEIVSQRMLQNRFRYWPSLETSDDFNRDQSNISMQ